MSLRDRRANHLNRRPNEGGSREPGCLTRAWALPTGTMYDITTYDYGRQSIWELIRHFAISPGSATLFEYNWESGIPLATGEHYYIVDALANVRIGFDSSESVSASIECDWWMVFSSVTQAKLHFSVGMMEESEGMDLTVALGFYVPEIGKKLSDPFGTVNYGFSNWVAVLFNANEEKNRPKDRISIRSTRPWIQWIFPNLYCLHTYRPFTEEFFCPPPDGAYESEGMSPEARAKSYASRWRKYLFDHGEELMGGTQQADDPTCWSRSAYGVLNYHSLRRKGKSLQPGGYSVEWAKSVGLTVGSKSVLTGTYQSELLSSFNSVSPRGATRESLSSVSCVTGRDAFNMDSANRPTSLTPDFRRTLESLRSCGPAMLSYVTDTGWSPFGNASEHSVLLVGAVFDGWIEEVQWFYNGEPISDKAEVSRWYTEGRLYYVNPECPQELQVENILNTQECGNETITSYSGSFSIDALS